MDVVEAPGATPQLDWETRRQMQLDLVRRRLKGCYDNSFRVTYAIVEDVFVWTRLYAAYTDDNALYAEWAQLEPEWQTAMPTATI